MNLVVLNLCSIQARLFALSVEKGYDSVEFIEKYMTSNIAHKFNSEYNRVQWLTAEVIIDSITVKTGKTFPKEIMFWIGYLYCFWHFKTKDSCELIKEMAPPSKLITRYSELYPQSINVATEILIKEYYIPNIIIEKEASKYNYRRLNNEAYVELHLNKYQILKAMERQRKLILANREPMYSRVSYLTLIIDLINASCMPQTEKDIFKWGVDGFAKRAIDEGFNKTQIDYLEYLKIKIEEKF